MQQVTKLFFYLYVAALLVIGCLGLIFAPWELARFLHLPVSAMPAKDAASLSNQYRFLKAMEFSCGYFSWGWRREIFTELRFLRLFLVILLGGVAGRLLSIVLDGVPHAAFIAFIVIEVVTGLLMLRGLVKVAHGQP